MAKSSNSSRSRGLSADTSDIARPEFDRLLSPVRPFVPDRALVPSVPDLTVEDLRQFDPSGPLRAARDMRGVPARVVFAPASAALPGRAQAVGLPHRPERFQFEDAREVLVCARRKARREVIFARRLNRKGAGAKRRRNPFTEVSC